MAIPKTHQNYWIRRLRKRTYAVGEGEKVTIEEYQVYIQHLGRREWFQLGSSNQVVAAKRAAVTYQSLELNGWDDTIQKYKGEMVVKTKEITVGDFLKAVQERSHLNPKTFTTYYRKFRNIVGDTKDKYDHFNGSHLTWRSKVDKVPLSYLTADRIRKWQKTEVAKAGHDPGENSQGRAHGQFRDP